MVIVKMRAQELELLSSKSFQTCIEFIHHFIHSYWQSGSRSKDLAYTSIVQEVVILWWDHTSTYHHNVVSTLSFEFLYQCRHQGLVSSSLRAHTNHMHI